MLTNNIRVCGSGGSGGGELFGGVVNDVGMVIGNDW